jgi:phosphocarrier protein HPr/phosphocarrier protein
MTLGLDKGSVITIEAEGPDEAVQFQSTILIKPEGTATVADGKSILNLMTLGLDKGSVITIEAEGPDEAAAVAELSELVESGFGEE